MLSFHTNIEVFMDDDVGDLVSLAPRKGARRYEPMIICQSLYQRGLADLKVLPGAVDEVRFVVTATEKLLTRLGIAPDPDQAVEGK